MESDWRERRKPLSGTHRVVGAREEEGEMAIEGFGIGLRGEFILELLETRRQIDWLEIVPENWLNLGGLRRRQLDQCAERWSLVPHSVTMSIGGPDPLDRALFDGVSELCAKFAAPFWSDHICHAVSRGTYFNDLFPLPCSDEALDYLLRRIDEAQGMASVPLVFENPTYYAAMPGATMSETTFFRRIANESGAGMLLDVNNVYVNSQNHGFDPERFIEELPLEAVKQIHLAGHTPCCGVVIDTHEGPIADPVWALYRHTLRVAGRLIPTLIEWDAGIPKLDAIVDELDRARNEAAIALAPRSFSLAATEAA